MKLRIILIGICFSIASLGYGANLNTRQVDFYSQASQDEFVYALLYKLLDKKDEGYYLEIGAGHPTVINNSYFLEKGLGWKGVSIDVSPDYDWYSQRNNTLLVEDALRSDYDAILRPFPQSIDYLSLDIDGNYDTVLNLIPFDKYIFKIITIEHDFYKFGDHYRAKEREILSSFGYYLLCPDVSCIGLTFEDWWIHPNAFPPSVFSTLRALDLNGKNHKEIMQSIQTLIQ